MSTTIHPQATKANQVLILHNPKAGFNNAQDDVRRLALLVQQRDFDVEIFTDLSLATEKANTYFTAGKLRVLVGVGGDGTAAELANRTLPGLPLTLFPTGNENLIARHLNLEFNAELLADTIAQGSLVHLDAGRAGERIFLMMASCGLDAEVVRRVHLGRTGHLRSRNYFKPLWDTLRTYNYPQLRIYCDEELDAVTVSEGMRACWFSVFNLPCYGGGLRLAPYAVGNDGQLDLCGFRRGNFWLFIRYISAVYLKYHQSLKDWITRTVKRVRIVSDESVPYQLDGDPGGTLPLEIEVLPNRLTMLVPKDQ